MSKRNNDVREDITDIDDDAAKKKSKGLWPEYDRNKYHFSGEAPKVIQKDIAGNPTAYSKLARPNPLLPDNVNTIPT